MSIALAARPTWNNPMRYLGYRIYGDHASGAPYRYAFQHEDYDGAEDANDNRYGFGNTIDECCSEIDEIEDDRREYIALRLKRATA